MSSYWKQKITKGNPITFNEASRYAVEALGDPKYFTGDAVYIGLIDILCHQIIAAAERAYQAGIKKGIKNNGT